MLTTLPLVLPPDLAYLAAADQNFDRDIRQRLIHEKSWHKERDVYVQEAFIEMQAKGQNYPPYFDDHEHIQVSPLVRCITHTSRSRAFLKALDSWYERQSLALMLGIENCMRKPHPIFYLNM